MAKSLMFSPPYASADACETQLKAEGHTVLAPSSLQALLGCNPQELAPLQPFWQDLPPDAYLRDGGRYRFRRHACFIAQNGQLTQAPHRAHWQPLDYNALHGGIERWFEPLDPAMVNQPAWGTLLLGLSRITSALKSKPADHPWYIEAHQFRIDTTDGIGRPTPEGAHRDGVELVAVFLVDRQGIKGGESRVFEAQGPQGQRFTMTAPWTLLLLDDEQVIHESTPIQPVGDYGYRDTLVITLRSSGFQSS
ncbi:2OG-Fe dioxygenase family protein [Roseateles koreensis]|uniref:2OG-Fe dioxygenase family protein n=1 Tax=Roseateles koreensis TaxID=2987526 RepID=A0ABT5KQ86_9BURK|nr:2OG-Fe dioxygenase family protein [Roseateles koreensis]MDC8785068.1 2OG-Fe dioxygenase family protein [Roseateles koreensis]